MSKLAVLTNEDFYYQSYRQNQKNVFGVKERYYLYSLDGRIGSTQNVNQPVTFRIEKKGSRAFLERARLITQVKFSVDSEATKKYYLNAMPIFQFQKIEIYCNNEFVTSFDGLQMYQDLIMHTTEDDQQFVYSRYGIGDDTFRAVNDDDVKTFYLDLNDFWNMFHMFPIYKLLDGTSIEVRVYFNNKMLTGDEKVTYEYLKTEMLLTYITPYSQKIGVVDRAKTEEFIEILPYSFEVRPLTTTTNQNHILSFLRGRPVVLLTFVYQTETDINAGKYTNFLAVNEFGLKAENRYIDGNTNFRFTDQMFREVILYDSDIENKDQLRNENLYFISYANSLSKVFSEDTILFNGFRYFHEQQPNLELVFSQNPSTSKIIVTVWELKSIYLRNGVLRSV